MLGFARVRHAEGRSETLECDDKDVELGAASELMQNDSYFILIFIALQVQNGIHVMGF